MVISANKLGKIAFYLLKSEDISTKLEGYETLEMLCAAYLEGEDIKAMAAFNKVWLTLPRSKKKYFINNVTSFKSSFITTPEHQDPAMN